MSTFFFCGAHSSKLDEKNRFVLPQEFRYALVEEGKLEFTIGMGAGGALCIWRKKEIEKMAQKMRHKLHIAKYQKFFTFFFSTLYHTTCDKLGRVLIPPVLLRAAKIDKNIIIAGVLDRLEIWPEEKYHFDLDSFLSEEGAGDHLVKLSEEIFMPQEGESEEALSCLSLDG